MPIVHMQPGDVLEMKKKHPCGGQRMIVLRVGSEIRIRCLLCGRDMVLDRIKLEKSIRTVIPCAEVTPPPS